MREAYGGYESELHEECGIAGVVYRDPEATDAGLVAGNGIYGLQHRGQAAAGIMVSDGLRVHGLKDTGTISEVFPDDRSIRSLGDARMAIAHTRWGTVDASDAFEAAGPHHFFAQEIESTIATSHNGQFTNTHLLAEAMGIDRSLFATDSFFANHVIGVSCEEEKDLTRGVIAASELLEGAFSLLVMDEREMVAVRDKHGFRPLVIGVLEDNRGYVFASETPALAPMGAAFLREVEPGEAVTVTEAGELISNRFAEADPKHCMFEFIYFARPSGTMNGIEQYAARERLGRTLAELSPVEADVVIGSPDSATPAAIGYAEQSGIPYKAGLEKDRYTARTYTQDGKAAQEAAALKKYTPILSVIEGKRVVVVDDSVVNGTTVERLNTILRGAGAKEVHFRITSPPIKWQCFYGVANDQSRLIAAKMEDQGRLEEELAAYFGIDSIAYLSVPATAQSIGLELGKFCTACFTGNYPVPVGLPKKQ